MGDRPDGGGSFRTCHRGGAAMKTITEKLASQLNSKEKAIAAVDVLTAVLLIVNDGASRKAAINTVAAIAREAMDRYGEAEQ